MVQRMLGVPRNSSIKFFLKKFEEEEEKKKKEKKKTPQQAKNRLRIWVEFFIKRK